jgi:hypothetical protein
MPVERTAVGKSSDVMQSMVFQAAMVNAWNMQALATIPLALRVLLLSDAKYAKLTSDNAAASEEATSMLLRPVLSMKKALKRDFPGDWKKQKAKH